MNIDYTKPIINEECSEEGFAPHYRFCPKCGQRFVLYGDDSFQTSLMIFRSSIKCPSCGEVGGGEPYNEDYQLNKN
jgi:ribosomal protein S27AE